MKNKKMNVLLIVLAVLLTATTAAFAQRGNQAAAGSCCSNIPGLTEEQKTRITALETQHLKDMQEMRQARRQSGSSADRDAHHAAADRKVTEHRNAVRSLLNDEQKTFFDNLQAQGGQGRNQQANIRRGNNQQGTMMQRGGRQGRR